MGASTYVSGVRDLDEKFESMWHLLEVCHENGVSVPKEVHDYFEEGIEDFWDLSISDPTWKEAYGSATAKSEARRQMQEVSLYGDGDIEYGDGMVINLADIPSDVKKIRIYMMA